MKFMLTKDIRVSLLLLAVLITGGLFLVGCEEIYLEEDESRQGLDMDVGKTNAPPVGPTPTNPPPVNVPRGVGDEEVVSSFVGLRPSIDVDTGGQPHIVTDDSSDARVALFHRIGGKWSGGILAEGRPGGRYDASRIYVPHIEIDRQNRAWISAKFGVKEFGTMLGTGLWCMENVNTEPRTLFFRLISERELSKGFGIVGVDPAEPGKAYVYSREGVWVEMDLSGNIRKKGKMYCGASGEKLRFVIAPREGQRGVWHAGMTGYSAMDSMYQNSVRDAQGLGPVAWASYAAYREMESDFYHPGIGRDGRNPTVCYLACIFNCGLVYNVWNGSKMLFSPGSLPVVDARAQFVKRFGPQWAPAPGGGAYLVWASGGRVKIVRVAMDGSLHNLFSGQTDPRDVCAGTNPTVCTDASGVIHLAYVNGGLRYRMIGIDNNRQE
ncbi:MAG: hypothetical protein N2255_07560 [Kiritimatiellae bacterium]|nr:hypothetical protein [Kiritimatiellia bacterium]